MSATEPDTPAVPAAAQPEAPHNPAAQPLPAAEPLPVTQPLREAGTWGILQPGTTVAALAPLFPRVEQTA